MNEGIPWVLEGFLLGMEVFLVCFSIFQTKETGHLWRLVTISFGTMESLQAWRNW